MLPPLIQRPRPSAAKRSRERGVTLALVAVALFSIIAMAGLSIDLGTLYQASAEAQRAADAGALAAAREISVSGITGAATTTNQTPTWQEICGAAGIATQAAKAVAQQNTIAGTPPSSVTVTYSAPGAPTSGGSTDCTSVTGNFGVNPVVTVLVKQASLPTYFSRIWGRTGSSVSATASAEAFNSSGSGYALGGVVPVQPRCVKPWMVPNLDPLHGGANCTAGCTPFVDKTTGNIDTPGIVANGSGIIGEQFWLVPDCTAGPATCSLLVPGGTPPQANYTTTPRTPNLEYLPGQTSFASTAVTSDGSAACSAVAGNYAQAIAGCDQSTQYQCGVPLGNAADLVENPGSADTMNGVQCLIHQATPSLNALSGQDALLPLGGAPPSYPFQIQAGTSNPLGVSGAVITSSTSIVSLPIYDSSAVTIFPTGLPTQVTIIGFLQVFINAVDSTGDVYVTVLNVAGCTNNASGNPVYGSSPVPVRLITPP